MSASGYAFLVQRSAAVVLALGPLLISLQRLG
jgi:hypothetical protein